MASKSVSPSLTVNNKTADDKKPKLLKAAYFILLFGFMVLFFTKIHPIVIFDSDDWLYITYKRQPFLLWKDWNPTRVFPELLMPLCGDIAGMIIYPLTGRYIESFTLVNGVVVSLFIILYIYMFFELLLKKWKLSAYQSFALSTVFFLAHFFIFRSATSGNEYLFYAINCTCYYYYVIPALLNLSLVLYLMRHDVLYDGIRKIKNGTWRAHIVRNGVLLLAFYMALFSNLFQSVILAACIGCQLLFELFSLIKNRGQLSVFFEKNAFRLFFIASWALEQIFEINGGRANYLFGENGTLSESLAVSVSDFLTKARSINILFIICCVFIICLAAGTGIAKHFQKNAGKVRGTGRYLGSLLLSGALTSIYLILLCSQAQYMSFPSVWLGIVFYFFIALALLSAYILKNIPVLDLALPFVILFLVVEIRTVSRTFADDKYGGVPNRTCVKIDYDIVSQFLQAENEGRSETVIYVPEFSDSPDINWPLATVYGSDSMSNALYRHGVTERFIKVTAIVPSREKNAKFNIP